VIDRVDVRTLPFGDGGGGCDEFLLRFARVKKFDTKKAVKTV